VSDRRTPGQVIFGPPPDVNDLIRLWDEALTTRLLALVWQAYDELAGNEFAHVDWTQPLRDVERSITELLERKIRDIMDGFLPCIVQHGPFERELPSAHPGAQPREYDIAFIWRQNQRVMWPLEAKVLQDASSTTGNLGDYIDTINTRYLTCHYAPFSSGGAMLGYLRSGEAVTVLCHISTQLGQALTQHPGFPARPHQYSDHNRTVPPGKLYVGGFRCHHLILPLSAT